MAKQRIYFPGREGQRVVVTALGRTEDISSYGTEPVPTQTLQADAGRVARFDGALAGITVAPVVVQSDGKSVLDLRALKDAATLAGTLNGDPVSISVAPRAQQRGMSSGLFYWLAQAADGRFRIEPGRRHRKVYVSQSPTAKTRAMIAAEAGVAETTVTGAWLAARPQYGGSETDVLAMDAFNLLKTALWPVSNEGRSDWIMLERGYSYSISWPNNEVKGQSELHPLVIDAWGTGARPHLSKGAEWIKPVL